MSPIISQDMVKGLIKDGYDYMLEKYDQYEEIAPKLMTERKMDGDFWQRTSVVNSGTWRKTGEQEGFQATAVIEGYTVYARIFDYTDAHSFSYNVVKDHQKIKDLVKTIAADWGTTSKETREEFYARIFNQGGMTAGDWIFNGTPESHAVTDGSGDLLYDSYPFFALTGNNHVSKGGGTYFNGKALSLDHDNLKTVKILMTSTNNRRENDTVCVIKPDTLLVPTSLEDTANEIINSTLVPYLTTNTTNVLKGSLNVVSWQYLNNATAWFVGKSKMGIEMLNRQEPVIDFFEDKKNRCYWCTAEMRIGVMVWNWRYWAGSNFSTA